jgi:hypothetical protein
MANWSLPSLTDLYTNFLAYLKGRDDDAARLNDNRVANATNLPDYAKRWNNTTKTFQEWVSSIWGNLVMGVAGGGTGASNITDARTNLDVYSKAEADAAFATTLTSESETLSYGVTMTSPSTDYSGPSISLSAGTWFIVGNACIYSGTGSAAIYISAFLWDGATLLPCLGYGRLPAASPYLYMNIPLSEIVVLGATTNIKVAATRNTTGDSTVAIAALRTWIRAVKIA